MHWRNEDGLIGGCDYFRNPSRCIDAVWRIESARLIAGLAEMVRDVGLAEELSPGCLGRRTSSNGLTQASRIIRAAWLMATAKHRALDSLRRRKLLERKHEEMGRKLESEQDDPATALDAALDDDVGDDLLGLVFTACHPVLSTEARVAFTLRLLCGLTTDEIARVPRLGTHRRAAHRAAKRTLAEKQVAFEVPHGAELASRVASVLEVIYLLFNEGYAATAGDEWMRPGLCDEALRLGRIVAELIPHEPEVHGLVALMEIQASRTRARVGASGEPIVLLEQNRALWDHLQIHRGLAALTRAEGIEGPKGPYVLQAAIAACHARARTPEETNWQRIAAACAAAQPQVAPSPIIELNRAVALSMAFGPAAGLTLVDELTTDQALDGYHLLPTVRGDLLAGLGRLDEARVEFERAAGLTHMRDAGTSFGAGQEMRKRLGTGVNPAATLANPHQRGRNQVGPASRA